MSCVSSCARYLLFFFNLLCALCGLGLLVLGVLIQLEVQTIKENVDGYIQGVPILLMIVGGITFMIAFDGCCGACKEHRCSLLVYAWSLVVILIIEIVVVVLAFVYSKDLNKESLRKYFEDYDSHKGLIDIVQVLLKCCGADGPQDFGVKLAFQMPRSCCENLDNCSLAGTLFTGLHTRGCVAAIEDFGRYQTYAMTAAIVIGVVEVPKTTDGWKWVAQEFEEQWNFPNCVGSADGKHVSIQKPPHSGSYYYNYKGFFSIVLMAIVDANYKFLMVDVGANGRVSDGGVLKNTLFWHKLSESQLNLPDPRELPDTPNKTFPYVFIGDEAFQLLPQFMKPYNRATLTNEKRIFNYRPSRARRVVENAFGILTKRFKIIQNTIRFETMKARKIVMACCHLHNYLCSKNRAKYLQPQDIDRYDIVTGVVEPGSWRQDIEDMVQLQKTRGNSTVEAKKIRDDFCEFFNTSGSVPW